MTQVKMVNTNIKKSAESHISPRRNSLRIILAVVAGVIALIAMGLTYIWFDGGSGQPSGVTTAPALVLDPGDTRVRFQVAPDESEVRFKIDEELLGNPKTVIGVTDEVAGEMLIDFDNPANSQLGMIRINVRTFATDNEIRNRALRGQILQADQSQFEFAEFTPTALEGLPDTVIIGTPIQFQIVGDLTVHGITREVTFDTTVTAISKSQLEGTASTVVLYRDFDISIPQAPGVANISDEVVLEIDFVAVASSE